MPTQIPSMNSVSLIARLLECVVVNTNANSEVLFHIERRGAADRGECRQAAGVVRSKRLDAPGEGKTQIKCDIAARISTGGLWPDGGRAPCGSIVMLSAEDPIKDVLRPRLEAAGADLRRVVVLESVVEKDGRGRSFNLQGDLDKLARAINQIGDVALVTLDPITAYMGSGIDSHRTTDVRGVLEPLAKFAEEMNVSVLCISHPPKATQSTAINSVTGSLAFTAAPRMVLVATKDIATDRRLLLPVKNTFGALPPGLGYRIAERTITKNIVAPHVVWDNEPVTMSADEAIREAASGKSGKLAEAKEFLREELADGPKGAETIIAAAARLEISERTLRRARKDLKIVPRHDPDFKGGWLWELPK
jgi:putative DNA primase/helicase